MAARPVPTPLSRGHYCIAPKVRSCCLAPKLLSCNSQCAQHNTLCRCLPACRLSFAGRQAAAAMAATTSDLQVHALRPVVLDHVIKCKLPIASGTLPVQPRPYVPVMTTLPLLPDLSGWLNHISVRDQLRQHLEVQVRIAWRSGLRHGVVDRSLTS